MLTILKPIHSPLTCPMVSHTVPAGFPSPADDYIEAHLDLNSLLIQHPNATFFVRVSGESMSGAGIKSGDTLVVDRSLKERDGDIVVAAVNGEFTVKKISLREGQIWLMPANSRFKPILLTDEMESVVWGVVTSVLHQFRR